MIHRTDSYFMNIALDEAEKAFHEGEVPVGAVLVRAGEVITASHNERERSGDPTAHAEILALRRSAAHFEGWRLDGAVLYVTKEPCIMCAGAIVNARIERLVYGCRDVRWGGVDSLYTIVTDERLNHRVTVESGVHAEESADLLRRFFRDRR